MGRARYLIALFVLLAVSGMAAWNLMLPGGEVARAALPALQTQPRQEAPWRESELPTEIGPAPRTGPASTLRPLDDPIFGKNYRANTDTQSPNLAQQEPSIGVNPTNPLNVVAAAKDEREGTNSKHVYIYTSTDGGVTWINQRFPYRAPAPGYSSDPVVNWSDDGICYVTSLPYGGGTEGIQITSSTDGGITFRTASQVTPSLDSDKEWTWIDNFPTSPFYHRMYVAWRNFGTGADITLSYSTDRGQTWSGHRPVATTAYQFPMPVVLPDGTVLVSYLSGPYGEILRVSRSTDGGVTFSGEQGVSGVVPPNCPPDNPGCSIWRLAPIPATAVDPVGDTTVIVWADGAGQTSTINYVRGTANGTVWGAVTPLAPPPGQNVYQIQPWVGADEEGTFHAIWYDNRDNPATSIFHLYYSQSTDAGATWSQATRISTAASDLRIGIPSSYNRAAGDYIQVDAAHGNVYAAWTDTRSGTGEDIYVVRGTFPSGGTPTPTATPCPVTGTWSITASQNPSTESNYLRDVSSLASNDVWAVGYATYGTGQTAVDRTLIQHWNGSTWSVVPSPNVGSSSNRLFGVVALAPNDVWAVGQYRFVTQPTPYDQTLIMRWNGSTWSVVPSPNPGTWNHALYDVDAASPSSVCAAGEYNPSLGVNTRTLIMCWNGTAWNTVSSPNGNLESYNSLRGITAIAPDDMWAAGYYGVTDGSQTLTLHWDGTSWTQVASANGDGRFSQLRGIDAVSLNDVWAVGYNNPDPGGSGNYIRSLAIHWDGTSWTRVPSPNPIVGASNYFNGVTAVSSTEVWAVGYHCAAPSPCGARTFTARWNGSEWLHVPSPNNETNFHELYAVDAVASGEVWAVGYSGPAGAYRTLALRYTTPPCGSPTVVVTSTSTATASRTVTSVPPTATRTSTSGVPTPVPTSPPPTATPCPAQFADVPADNTFYPFVRCLACRGIIGGYPCGGAGEPCNTTNDPYFRPNNNITRGQIAKIVSQSAGLGEDPGPQIYEDVPEASPFYVWINRLSNRGYMGGYPCGLDPNEPCVAPENRPYFRPNANATRGQLSKIVSEAAGFSEPHTSQTFEDVPLDNPFYIWIERLVSRQIMGGYVCGGPGEPCGVENRPYFRWGNTVTRGQASKIVANTFFPNCQTPDLR